jgi:hypothetical protein
MIRKRNKKQDTLAPKILTAQFMIYVNALIWFGFAIYIVIDMLGAHNSALVVLMTSFFLLINIGAMTFCGVIIGRRETWAYYLCIVIMVLNAVFTRLGEFNTYSLIAFILDVIILAFLLSMGRAYLKEA